MKTTPPAAAQQLLDFWQDHDAWWFEKNDRFDQTFRERFHALHWQAARRELEGWLETEEGALALVLLLDQYPRNSFRDTGHMFATDGLARHYARILTQRQGDLALPQALRVFCYLPFTHHENLEDQHLAVELNERGDTGEGLYFARHHRDIIQRFGRFPHRNRVLGRESSPQELTFLADGGFQG